MAEIANKVVYRDTWLAAYERNQSMMRTTVTTEAMISGYQAVFLVAATNRSAVSRGPNGLIPNAVDDLTQSTVTLVEEHDKPRKTKFNIFAGQSNQREIMQKQSRKVINRAIDDAIITILATGTVTANPTTSIMTKQLVNLATTALWNANVPNDGDVFGAVTPAAWNHLGDIPEFTSKDYVTEQVLINGIPNSMTFVMWNGVKWFQHTGLPNMGLSTAQCFLYHRDAIGHAVDSANIQALADYNDEDDYYWARTTIYHGALKIQNAGIVVINHDDSQYS